MEYVSDVKQGDLIRAAQCLKSGNLVAFPTETVYGLGADATNPESVSQIYAVKGRPANHPLIVHISSLKLIDKWARNIPDYAFTLAEVFWPGPMTLVLPRSILAKDFITGSQDTVGLRIPANNYALKLLSNFEIIGGLGVAAPSANRFGAVSPTSAFDVQSELGDYLNENDMIIDGGECEIGIESTIIDCTKRVPLILRPGAINSKMISGATGLESSYKNENNERHNLRVPGMLKNHYAPNTQIILNGFPTSGDGFIALNNISTPVGAIRLASPNNSAEFAKILYRSFRLGDEMHLKRIIVIPPKKDELSVAVLDRIEKASYKINV